LGYILTYMPFLSLILSGIATYISLTTRRNALNVEKSLRALHRHDVLKRAEVVYGALLGLKQQLEPDLLLYAPKEYGLSHDLLARCFTRNEQKKIIASWEQFNIYIEKFWLDNKGEFQTLSKLGWNDIGRISLDKSEDAGGIHGKTMHAFEELIELLKAGNYK
jgi:hypothetical protein